VDKSAKPWLDSAASCPLGSWIHTRPPINFISYCSMHPYQLEDSSYSDIVLVNKDRTPFPDLDLLVATSQISDNLVKHSRRLHHNILRDMR
jgi:hypothetical protein